MEEEEEAQQNPVSFTFGHLQYALQEAQQEPQRLLMILDAWKDTSTSADWPSFGSQPIWSETTLVGSLIASIVGLEGAEFNDHELLEFVRYQEYPYDLHAIKVLNASSREVGYLRKPVAKVLSPLVDDLKIYLEGEVTCTGIRNNYSVPCVLRIIAKSDDVQIVKNKILEKGLLLFDQPGTSFGSSEGMEVKVETRIEKLGTLEPPKIVNKAKLLDHQKEGLWWLVNKEKSDELPPFWEVKDGLYLNVLTRHQTNRRPEPLHGGIYADDYGSGKTLTFLSLIAFDKFGNVPEGTGEEDEGESVSSCKNKGRVSEKDTGGQEIHTLLDSNIKESYMGIADMSSNSSVAKQTLIVCPSAVCSPWENQIQEHTQRGSLQLYKYYGNSRTQDVEELKKYDIVLTTYSTLVADGCEHIRSALMKIEWWRVILDEAHVIKNAKQSWEFTKLTARRRWAVTGAPIQNGSFDLFPLMAFFRLVPLSTECFWKVLLQKPLANGDEKGLSRLQVLMTSISLRRIKEEVLVGLPSKTVETIFFELSGEERELYNRMEEDSKIFVGYFFDADTLHSRYTYVLFLVIQLRQLCNDSALCSLNLRSLLPSDNIGDASKHPELLRKMMDVLQDGEDFHCAICLYPPTDAAITICEHIFCKKCIWYYLPLNETKQSCPICRRPVSRSDLFSAPPESSNPENPKKPSRTTPSKVSALIKHLRKESRVVNSTSKSVVFSLFDKMLALMEEPLEDAGFNTVRLDTSTDERRQLEIIKEFEATGAETVLLASLKTFGTGINLTAASKVYLLEPWWNPEIEEQAINRVHQYGQQENVRIFRLIAENSIEERILKMQERKKAANETFGRRGPMDQHEASIDDLRSLLFLS